MYNKSQYVALQSIYLWYIQMNSSEMFMNIRNENQISIVCYWVVEITVIHKQR